MLPFFVLTMDAADCIFQGALAPLLQQDSLLLEGSSIIFGLTGQSSFPGPKFPGTPRFGVQLPLR